MSLSIIPPLNTQVIETIYISAVGTINASNSNTDEITVNPTHGIALGARPHTGWLQEHPSVALTSIDDELPAVLQRFSAHRSRNNQLLLVALMQIQPQTDNAIARFSRDRIVVVLGTSTSGLDESDVHVDLMLNGKESTDWCYSQQELGDPSRFLSYWLALDGPASTLLAACSSSARVIMSGRRLIESGLADIAIIGGTDTLSQMSINGFRSLESLPPTLCQPSDRNHCGITIGESAALIVLTREPQPTVFLDVGESSDAYHTSAPHPQGEDIIHAIDQALNDAGMTSEHVGYINPHDTTTPLNDQIESNAVSALFGETVLCSSTKYLTGYMLGAAGVTEVAINMLILQRELPLPPQDFSQSPRDEILPPYGIIEQPQLSARPVILSNSSTFGGNNASTLPGRIS